MFGLLQAVAFYKYMQTYLSKAEFRYFFMMAGAIILAILVCGAVALSMAGVVAPWSGRLLSFIYFFLPKM